jgi:hypothetical protein
MLFVRPNAEIFADMLKKIVILKYDPWQAEQAFLNAYMRFSVWRLPYMYNGNLAILHCNPQVWKSLLPSMAIIHYTIAKPHKLAEDRKNDLYGAELGRWWEMRHEMEERENSGLGTPRAI